MAELRGGGETSLVAKELGPTKKKELPPWAPTAKDGRDRGLKMSVTPDPLQQAKLYAALHVGNPGDVAFYVRACHGAKHVLELGSGAGRVTLALAEAGHHVTGVELDAGLLGLAREQQLQRETTLLRTLPLEWVAGDMTTFVRANAFERVIIPYSAFWCLPDDAAKLQCLTNAYTSLVDGGQLILDVYDADVWMDEEDDAADGEDAEDEGADAESGAATGAEEDDYEELQQLTVDGVSYRVWERNTWHPAARVMHVEYQLRPDGESGTIDELTLTHAVLWRHELAELLEECGFEVEFGGDEDAEGTDFAEQIVVRAVK